VFNYARKHYEILNGNDGLRELESFGKSKRNNVLKSVIALSKYLGIYPQFKTMLANHGFKWETQNSFESFLRIIKPKEDLDKWVRACLNVLDESEATFIKFVMISGIRKDEALKSFNLIITLSQQQKLSEYYNLELEVLEHFRFGRDFIRGSKNVFFSFIPKEFIDQIAKCEPASYAKLRKRLRKHNLNVRLNELRDQYATFMVHNGLIKEEVDLLQGRVGKSIFMRHYFSPAIKELKDRVLKATENL